MQNLKKTGGSLSVISRYRSAIFGISILGILLFHFSNDVLKWRRHDVVYKLAEFYYNQFGSIGVEIFLFLSGVGLYFSLSKNPDVKSFYERRLRRVLIPYLLWGGFYWFIRDILVTRKGVAGFFYDLTMLSFWCEGKRSVWFIALLIILYAAFPLLFRAMNWEVKGKERAGFFCLALCVGWIAICSFLSIVTPVFYHNIEVAFSRVPIFIIGTWYGKRIKNNENFRTVDGIFTVFGFLLITLHMMSEYSLFWVDLKIHNRFLACVFSISLLFILCGILSLLHSDKIGKALALAGSYSLELYICHVGVRGLLMVCDICTHRFVVFAGYILLSVFFSVVLHQVNKKIQSS